MKVSKILGSLALVLGIAPTPVLAHDTPGLRWRPTQSITQIVAASGGSFDNNRNDFDILLTAVQTAGLAGALGDTNANLTVFAPTDAAFIRLARDLGFAGNDEAGAWNYLVTALTNLGNGDPIPVLTSVLTYHVVGQRLNSVQIIVGGIFNRAITTLQGGTIRWFNGRIVDADPEIANPRIVRPNVPATNGIIHVVDRVLLPVNL